MSEINISSVDLQNEDCDKILQFLKIKVDSTKIERDNIDPQLFLSCNNILKFKIETIEDEEVKWEILIEVFRFLRNCCAESRNQDLIRNDHSELVDYAINFINSRLENKTEEYGSNLIIALRCAIQFLGNFTNSNIENCKFIEKSCLNLFKLIKEKDKKVAEYSAMLMHSLGLTLPGYLDSINSPENIELIVDKSGDSDFLYLLFEKIVVEKEELILQNFPNFDFERKMNFYHLIKDMPKLGQNILNHLFKYFNEKSDIVLKSELKNINNENCLEIVRLIGTLSSQSAIQREAFKGNFSLLTTSIFLLRQIHEQGKSSEENTFSPKGKLQNLKDDFTNEPSYFIKSHLVQLIGNLVYKQKEMQDFVREQEALPIILECSQLDAKNPLITQWAILTLRNLAENNPENQKIINNLEQRSKVDFSLSNSGRLM